MSTHDPLMLDTPIIAETIAATSQGMTLPEAVLSVLAPFATGLLSLATVFMRRHFKHLDSIEVDLKARTASEISRAKVDAEIAAELRLSRESRETHAKKLTELEDKLAAKIDGTKEEVSRKLDDNRLAEVRDAVHELRSEVVSGGIGAGAQLSGGEDPPRARRAIPSVPEIPSPPRSHGSARR